MSAIDLKLGADDGSRTRLTNLGSSGYNHYMAPARTLNFTIASNKCSHDSINR